MVYYKLGPFSTKSDASSVTPIDDENSVSKQQQDRDKAQQALENQNVEHTINRLDGSSPTGKPISQSRNGVGDDTGDDDVFLDDIGPLILETKSIDGTAIGFFRDPLEYPSFNFEKNTGIKDRKAAVAYTKFHSLTAREKSILKPCYNDCIVFNHTFTNVNFTNAKNIGIVHVLARYFASEPDTIDEFIGKISKVNNAEPSIWNLFVELSCHIKMRENNGTVDLSAYHDYFYTIDYIAAHKERLGEYKDLNERAVEEAKLLNTRCYDPPMFCFTNSNIKSIIWRNYIDTIIPPGTTIE